MNSNNQIIRIRGKEFEVVDVQFDRHNFLHVTVQEVIDQNELRKKIIRSLCAYELFSSTCCVPSIMPVSSQMQGEPDYVDSDR